MTTASLTFMIIVWTLVLGAAGFTLSQILKND